MLANTEAMATVAVSDMAAAREFYGNVLGLRQNGSEGEELLSYLSGSSVIIVYRSDFAGTNKATGITWSVGDEIGEIVTALRDRGVTFEHYQMPGLSLHGDIHVGNGMKLAWFSDPDGNILNIVGS